MKPFLTVFIPAYNEESNLEDCITVVSGKMDEMNISTSFLIIDDGSTDGTGPLADALAAKNDPISSIHHEKNLGVGGAFLTAVENAQSEWLILIPADLALAPDELRRYIEASSDADIVVGLRSDRSDYTFLRHMVSWANIRLIQTLFQMKLHQYQYISMYRLDLLHQMKIEYWRSAFFLAEILIKARDMGKRLVEVEIRYAPRLRGRPTGAKMILIIRTVIDMIQFWLRWVRCSQVKKADQTYGGQT
jgi:glycosyltransferase involved in cell wall biosynthesis